MKISEQIAELQKKRGLKVQAMEELRERTQTDNRVFTDEESTAFDEVSGEVKKIDTQIEKLTEMELIVARQAKPVVIEHRITGGNRAVPPGIGMVRMVRAKCMANGSLVAAREIARSMWGDTPEVEQALHAEMLGMHLRAAVPPATMADPNWAGVLATQQVLANEFIALVQPLTIVNRLNLRQVPFNVKIPLEVTPIGTAQWVGEGKPKPFGKGTFDLITIALTKLALITGQTDELARSSDPSSEALLRDGLVNAIARTKNSEFISLQPPVPGVRPGGILVGIAVPNTITSSGATVAAIHQDLVTMISLLNGGEGGDRPAWIMNPLTKTWLSMLQTPMGTSQYPSVGANSTLMGYPIVDSTLQPASDIILLDQARILLAEDPGITIDMSREASIQLDSAPVDPALTLVSAWQNNLVLLRAEQYTYWRRATDTSVVRMNGITWTDPVVLTARAAPPVPPATGSHSTKQSKEAA
jgi:HK97 family phage major capsid protein